jgi:hypothetical protein
MISPCFLMENIRFEKCCRRKKSITSVLTFKRLACAWYDNGYLCLQIRKKNSCDFEVKSMNFYVKS